MLIDTSHCGERTTLDAIALSPKAIAVTHSNCKALNAHPRNKSDEVIRNLAAKGGVMGITGVRMFIKAKDPTTVADMADHIDHVVKLVGIEHVGIGSDFDGVSGALPEGLRSVADYPNLVEALRARGRSDATIRKVLGGNLMRTWQAVQAAATR